MVKCRTTDSLCSSLTQSKYENLLLTRGHIITGLEGFVGFTRIAGVIQVITGLGVILAYHISRKRTGGSPICSFFGTLPFQIIVVVGSLASTVGSLIKVV